MSNNDNCHCTGSTKVVKSHGKASSENRHRGCGRDMLGQTVPSTGMGSDNREGPITNDGDMCMMDSQ